MVVVNYRDWVVSQDKLVEAVTLFGKSRQGPNRRAEARQAVSVALQGVQVDASYRPLGEAITFLTRDISTAGIGLLTSEAILEPYLLLDLPMREGRVFKVLARVIWQEPIGSGVFRKLGAEFIVK